MAASVNTSGSQTAVLTTEHVLATVATAGTFLLAVDASALVNGETVTLRVYGKARTTDTERLIKEFSVSHAQLEDLLQTPAYASPHHIKFTLEQNGGTGRAFPWAVYAL